MLKVKAIVTQAAILCALNSYAGQLRIMNLSGQNIQATYVTINGNKYSYDEPINNNQEALIGSTDLQYPAELGSFKVEFTNYDGKHVQVEIGTQTVGANGYSPYFVNYDNSKSEKNISPIVPFSSNDLTLVVTGTGQGINGINPLQVTAIGRSIDNKQLQDVSNNSIYTTLDTQRTSFNIRPDGDYLGACTSVNWDPARQTVSGKCDPNLEIKKEEDIYSQLNYSSCLSSSSITVTNSFEMKCAPRVALDSIVFRSDESKISYITNNSNVAIMPVKAIFKSEIQGANIDASACINKTLTPREDCPLILTPYKNTLPKGNITVTYSIISSRRNSSFPESLDLSSNQVRSLVTSIGGTSISSDAQNFQITPNSTIPIVIQNIGGSVWTPKKADFIFSGSNLKITEKSSCLFGNSIEPSEKCSLYINADKDAKPGMRQLKINNSKDSNLIQPLVVTFNVPETEYSQSIWIDSQFPSATTVKVTIKNTQIDSSNNLNLDPLNFSIDDTESFDIYSGSGDIGWCNENECSNSCTDKEALRANQFCSIYVHANSSVFAGEEARTGILSINSKKSVNYNLINTPRLYNSVRYQTEIKPGVIQKASHVLVTSKGGRNMANWQDIGGLPVAGQSYADEIKTDSKGNLYVAIVPRYVSDLTNYIVKYNPITKSWGNYVSVNISGVTDFTDFAIGNNGDVFVSVMGNKNGVDLYKYTISSNKWTLIGNTGERYVYAIGFNEQSDSVYSIFGQRGEQSIGNRKNSQWILNPISNLVGRATNALQSNNCKTLAECPQYVAAGAAWIVKKGNTSSWTKSPLFTAATMTKTPYGIAYPFRIPSIKGNIPILPAYDVYNGAISAKFVAYSDDLGNTTKIVDVPDGDKLGQIATTNILTISEKK